MMTPFSPRPIEFLGIGDHFGYRFKLYSVVMPGRSFSLEDAKVGYELALAELPSPAITHQRPGVGFCIFHWGNGADYVVLCWWDNENELPISIWIRREGEQEFRPAQKSESFCVWDLQIISFERDAYVQTFLSEVEPAESTYLHLIYGS